MYLLLMSRFCISVDAGDMKKYEVFKYEEENNNNNKKKEEWWYDDDDGGEWILQTHTTKIWWCVVQNAESKK